MLAGMTETQEKWVERTREWRASGQTAREYGQGRGFKASTLRYWASRLSAAEGKAAGAMTPKARARVRMAGVVAVAKRAAASLTVRVDAALVEVRPSFDRGLLRDVLEALGGQSMITRPCSSMSWPRKSTTSPRRA
jgi:hypothetical protein